MEHTANSIWAIAALALLFALMAFARMRFERGGSEVVAGAVREAEGDARLFCRERCVRVFGSSAPVGSWAVARGFYLSGGSSFEAVGESWTPPG